MASMDYSTINRPMLICCGRNENFIMPPPIRNPHNPRPELKQTEDLLASEMNNLTVQERLNALDDVHCVGEELKETPEMIEHALQEFEKVVQIEKNDVYNLALAQNRAYVEDPSFRLTFLRANLYDVDISVRKMMNLLKCKAKYFGYDKVARDITLDDLNQEDMELMLSGSYHIQDGRDRSGRVVIYMFNHLMGSCNVDSLGRVAYYIWIHIIVPIPEVQMKGANAVYYDLTKPDKQIPTPGFGFVMEIMQLSACLPVRNSAIHICLKNYGRGLASYNAILQFALDKFSKHERVRASLQVGSDMELQYHLRGRGIPAHGFPVDDDGNLRQDILNVWFYKHRDGVNEEQLSGDEIDNLFLAEGEDDDLERVEEIPSLYYDQGLIESGDESMAQQELELPHAHNGTVEVSDRDVLLGKGKSYQNHPGNVYFRSYLEKYSDSYDRAPRNARRNICTQVNHILRAKGVRFLQQQGAMNWVECDPKEAEKKIGQLFRSIRKRK